MNTETIVKVLKILKKEYKKHKYPIVTEVAEQTRDPFKILISTVLSLRTKDAVTREASKKLFERAKKPEDVLNLSEREIQQLIFPVGFYRTKAKNIKKISKALIDRFDGKVPDNIEELLSLPGVGRKTANLVITLGFEKMGICVDTHVHRISNRFGYVKTKTPERTEIELRKKLPRKWWKEYNDILVTWGQNVCTPISPKCSHCPVYKYCERVGVKNHR